MNTTYIARHAFLGFLTIALSITTLVFIFYFFEKDQKSAQLRVFSPGGMVPVLVSVLGAEETEQQVMFEYGVEHEERGRLFSQRVQKTLKGAEVLTQEIPLPESMVAGVYAAFVNIADERGDVIEAGRLRFEVRAAGFSLPQFKLFLLYFLFCVAAACSLCMAYLLFKKHNRHSAREQKV